MTKLKVLRRKSFSMKKCGLLMPVFSLPSKYGIGTLGKWAYKFIDFLKNSGHSYWQILPISQTGFADSPYASCASISGNPYFIDLEILRDEHLLTYREVEAAIDKSERIDYGKLYQNRYPLLRKAFSRFDRNQKQFKSFLQKGEYKDYAVFMALKKTYDSPWNEWPEEYRRRDKKALAVFSERNKDEILFWQFLQFEFNNQYFALKKYANQKGVSIIGDLPLYLSYDSVDVWVNPDLFLLDENFKPTLVAGVPPDYFSKTGQLWGNPIYNYEKMAESGFAFWKNRILRAEKYYDLVRIDHFRGLDRFWAVPYGDTTAENGWWEQAPGREIFSAIGSKNIVAEDLGLIDDGVRSLMHDVGAPGMKVLLFAFDGGDDNPYLPWNFGENSIIYTGTHDNDTLVGRLRSLDKKQLVNWKVMIKKSADYLKIYKPLGGVYAIAECIIDIAYASNSKICITPVHDVLLLDGDYRINEPGKTGCWTVRIKESVFTKTLETSLKRRAKRFNRS